MFQKILLVDDDKVCSYLHYELLQELHIARQIVPLANGRQALDYLKTYCFSAPTGPEAVPDLILLDLNMPVMDGLEFLQELMHLGQAALICASVVMLTTSDHAEDQLQAGRLRVKDYLMKPLTAEKMTDFVNRHYGATGNGN